MKQKRKKVDKYLGQANVYKSLVPLKFDLRKYADYVKKNDINSKDVTDNILNMFIKS